MRTAAFAAKIVKMVLTADSATRAILNSGFNGCEVSVGDETISYRSINPAPLDDPAPQPQLRLSGDDHGGVRVRDGRADGEDREGQEAQGASPPSPSTWVALH